MLFQYLLQSVVRKGSLRLVTAEGGTRDFGDGSSPKVVVKLHRKGLEWSLGLDPDLKIGEAYVDGALTLEEGTLHDLIHILLSNYKETGDRSPFHWREGVYPWLSWLAEVNPIARARLNAAFHYDAPDELYHFFLDSDRQYSCGYFSEPHSDLERAQFDKKRHIAAKLRLDRPNLKVLDIGSGWGGLGLYLAQENRCWVNGITLSVNQCKISRDRAKAAELEDRCTFTLKDYRQVEQTYDRIVSVGMFEHVGKKNYDTFFSQIKRLLSDDGVCLIHAIGRFGPPRPVNSFIRKHIFPGADLPTLSEVLRAVERSGLFTTDMEILRLHYAETLKIWAERFSRHRDEIIALFGEKMFRKWLFYFKGCEAGFGLGTLTVFQLQLTKKLETLPITRDYMFDLDLAHRSDLAQLDRYVEEIGRVSAILRRS